MVRVLITLEPRMYRQALALALRRGCPHSEVLPVAEVSLNGQVHDFAPHVIVRSDFGPEVPEEKLGSVVCRVEVLYTDHMGVRVSVVGGKLLHHRGREHGGPHLAGGRGRGLDLGLAPRAAGAGRESRSGRLLPGRPIR
jgi:hypothetical protein